MKKLIVLMIAVLFLATGCFTTKKENPEPDIEISSTENFKVVDGSTVKVTITDKKSETVAEDELEIVTNATRVDVYVNGVKTDLINGNLNLPEKVNNTIVFEAKREIMGEEFIAKKEMSVMRTDISLPKGSMVFPNNNTLYNSYGLETTGIGGGTAKDKSVKAGTLTAIGNIVYRTATTRDITEVPVVKAQLQGVYAELPVTGIAGGDWANGNSVTIYVVLNNSIVDSKTGSVANGYVQYKTQVNDDNNKITIGKPLSTSLGAATNYSLTEGKNEIYLFVVNNTDTAKAAIRVGNGNLPVEFMVDTIRPTLTISEPLNNGYFAYTPNGTVQSVNLKASAKDANWVYLYGVILKGDTSTLTDDVIGTAANKLYKTGTGGTPLDDNWIKNENELELSLSKLDMRADGTANGTKDLLVIMARDKNGNSTIRYVTVTQAPAFISDLSTLELRDGTGSASTALYNKYVENMSLTQSNISFRYTVQAGEVGTKVKIFRKVTPDTGNIPLEKPLTKELAATAANARILEGDYNLVTDFGYTTEDLDKGEVNLDLWMRITPVSGVALPDIPIKMRHIKIDTLIQELKMSKDDLQFRTAADAVFDTLPNGYSSKIYFDDNSDGDADSKVDIGKIVITKPVNREYIIQIGDVTYPVDDDNAITFATPFVMNSNRPVIKVNVYFREVALSNLLGSFDVVYMQDPNNLVTVSKTTIKQNTGKIELTGQINMPINVVNEYTFDVNMSNANGLMNLRATEPPVMTTYTGTITNFAVRTNFNYGDVNATNYIYDILKLNLKSSNDVILTAAKNIALDQNTTDNSMSVYGITLQGIESDSDTTWKITNYNQYLNVLNAGKFEKITLEKNGQPDSSFVNGSTINLGGVSKIKLIGKIPNVEVYVEREIAISYTTTNAPKFENTDPEKQVEVIKEADNVMKVTGYVTNHKNTVLKIYLDNVLLANPLLPELAQIYYLWTDTQYAYSVDRPFITVDIGSPERQGKNFGIKLEAYNTVDKVSGYFEIKDPTYYDTFAPTEYYAGKNGNGNRRFPDGFAGTNVTNSLDRFYIKYVGTNSAELMVDDKPTEETYNNAVALNYIENNLVMGNTQFSMNCKDATVKMGFRAPFSDDGYFAVVQNQTGDSDYIIGRVPVSESDGDYTVINSPEQVTVVLNLDGNITELVVGTDNKITGGLGGMLQQDDARGFAYNIGNNKYNKISISLKDGHQMETAKWETKNTNYSPITNGVAYADIIEGDDVANPVGRVVISSIPNLKGTTVSLYEDALGTKQIWQYTDQDLTVATPAPYDLSGVKGGDKVYLRVKDKYGNGIQNDYLTLTVADKVPPVLPQVGDITSDQSGATSDKLTFYIEPAAEAFIISGNLVKTTYDDQKLQNVAKITYTDEKNTSGIVYRKKVVAEVPRSKDNKDLFLVLADSFKNLTTNSKFVDNRARQISSLVVYSYEDIIPSDIAVNPVNGASTPYGLDESIMISWEPITTGLVDKYKVAFYKGTEELFNVVQTGTTFTIKMDDFVTKYKVTPFDLADITVKVSGISKKGIEGLAKSASNPVEIDLSKPSLAAIVDKSKIVANVSADNVIYFTSGSFDLSKAGRGKTGDYIDVAVYNTTAGKYDAATNTLLAQKTWSDVSDFLEVEGIGAVENNTMFFVRLKDAAGNVSALPTTQTNYLISATDDEAPKMSTYLKVSSMSISGTKGTVKIKYDVPASAYEGDYVEVFVYGYSDDNTKPDPADQLGYVKLLKSYGYEASGTTGNGLAGLTINFAAHSDPLAAANPDATKVFLRMRDAKGNITTKATEIRLSELITNNPF